MSFPTFRAFCMAAFTLSALGACAPASAPPAPETPPASTEANPLLSPFDTPFGVPPFDAIRDEHFRPAIAQGMAEQRAEIDAIVALEAEPTFANTIEAIERSGATLSRATGVFYMLNSADTNDERQAIAREIAPQLAAHSDAIWLNADLFARVDAVAKAGERLLPEQQRLLNETHKRFVRSGIALDGEPQDRLRQINARLSELSQTFQQNMLAETNAFELVLDEDELEGLPESLVASAYAAGERREHHGRYVITLQNPSIFPFLSNSPLRHHRETAFRAYFMRGDNDNEHDNKAVLAEMAALRAERAALLGYESHAHYVLEEAMAETPENVYGFLDQLWPAALAQAAAERTDLQAMMNADGVEGELQPWDWWYYAEQIRRTRYEIDEEAVRAYFPADAVAEAAFDLANRLFGLTLTERPDLPIYHEDVTAYEVRDADGSPLGIFYTDFYTRDSKRGGAWMNSTTRQSRLDGETLPVVYNTSNFPPPTDGRPSLLSYDEATTLFHEFGHALHGLLSDVTYESLSGTAVPRDFVEFPSQVLENWVGQPDFLRTFARHYRTGEPISEELMERLLAAEQFNQGFRTTEYLAASYLDLAWHTLTEPETHDARAFETAEMERIGLIDAIIPRYRSTYFAHIFSGGYSSGYYSYIWSEVLDADVFAQFERDGLFNRELAERYRREVLARGNTRPAAEHVEAFLGREPEVEPLIRRRGLDRANPARGDADAR